MHFHLLPFQGVMCESKQNVQGDSSSLVRVLCVTQTPCHTLTFQNSHWGFGQVFHPSTMAPDCWKAPKCCVMLQYGMHVAHRACLWSWQQQRAEQTRWQVWLWWSCSLSWWWRHNATPTGVLGRDAKAVNSKTLPSQKTKGKKTQQPNAAAVIKC